ncbi:MAG TPA: GNAT family N-acetyltransferase [Promineifilum sp.]|nr:GNAT family N-acetyltransferase [Promineifilum sp.]HQF70128.1 GNAT family N-acetyltransferase [Promineifilum sp.]
MDRELTLARVAFRALGDEWHDLVRAGYHDDYNGMGELYSGVTTVEDKIAQMQRWGEGIDAWTARDDGRLAGILTAAVDDDTLTVYDFFVDPAYQRRGIGRTLLTTALATPGVRQAAAEINLANAASRRLFESLGFAPQQTVGWYIRAGEEGSDGHQADDTE